MMQWLVYQKTASGELRPLYGPLGEFAGGAIMYAGMALVIVVLFLSGLRGARRGRKRCLLLSVYALVLLTDVALAMVMHARPKGSPEFHSAWLYVTAVGMVVIIGGPPLMYMVGRDLSGRSSKA